jgi:hypothetical protein
LRASVILSCGGPCYQGRNRLMSLRPMCLALLLAALLASPSSAWNNGQSGSGNPPYATHDWIAD